MQQRHASATSKTHKDASKNFIWMLTTVHCVLRLPSAGLFFETLEDKFNCFKAQYNVTRLTF